MKTTTRPSKHSINRAPCRLALLIPLALVCFALLPQARAVCQQGCDTDTGNTFLGDDALVNNTTGNENTALGQSALANNTTAADNTAVGFQALQNNTVGLVNTAIGANALYHNVNGQQNTAIGVDALRGNQRGSSNTATGESALRRNANGSQNTATGEAALFGHTTGDRNTATGYGALYNGATGDDNTAIGWSALYFSTGPDNVGVGAQAGAKLTTGNGNVCLGAFVWGTAGERNTTRIRNVYSSVASDRAVYVTADNKIGTLMSSRRFKQEIKPMDKASEAILALQPVSFRYKKEIESNGSIMFGLIAEDVGKADPDLVTRNEKGEPETVRYDAVNAMLLNEFLKEHKAFVAEQRKVQELEANAVRQQKQIDALAAGLQKVSAQLELSKAAPETVVNDQ